MRKITLFIFLFSTLVVAQSPNRLVRGGEFDDSLSNLRTSINAKSNTGHSHVIGGVLNLQDSLSNKYTKAEVNNLPILKDEDLFNNEAYSLFDNLSVIENNPTNYPLLMEKEIVDLTNFPLPFTRAIKLSYTEPLPGYSKTGIVFNAKYKPRFVFSSWVQLLNLNGNEYGYIIDFIRGINDGTIKTIEAKFRSSAEFTAMRAAIDSDGYWESALDGYTLRSEGYITWNGLTYVHLSCRITEDVAEADYIRIQLGNIWLNGDPGSSPTVYLFGMQLHDSILHKQNYAEVSRESVIEEVLYEKLDNFADSYLYDNEIVDFFNGGRYNYLTDQTTFQLFNSGAFTLGSGFAITSKVYNSKFNEGYVLEYGSSASFPKHINSSQRNDIIQFATESYLPNSQRDSATIGFWIDRRELNGNGLIFMDVSGATWVLRPSDLVVKGFKESRNTVGDPLSVFEVSEIDGDFSHIKFNLFNTVYNNDKALFRIAIYNTSTNNVVKLTIYNPTLIYNKNINPYYRYKSLAEKNNSPYIGKKLLYIGDSEYNCGNLHIYLSKTYGFKVIDAHYGSHSMQLKTSNLGQTNYFWFYHTNLRNAALSITDVDYYLFTTSSNDDSGGGESSIASIQAVYDNYPVYGDDADTVTAKMNLFNALSNEQKTTIFAYKNCYSAYLKQILTLYPTARIILCSVPISCSGYLTGSADASGHGIWAEGKSPDVARTELTSKDQAIRNDVLELKNKYNLNFVDLLNEVGLTYENFTNFCVDSVHWFDEIKIRIAKAVAKEIIKM